MANEGKSRRGLNIVFKELDYTVPSNYKRGEYVKLLKEISGSFESGQMAALMGPSGCGKTTLIDVLAGRKTQGQINGEITFGSQKPSKKFLKRYTGYVEQFDTLLDALTVRDMLLYTAELKRPKEVSLASKKDDVEALIDKLGLRSCADLPIGNSMKKGISGGQAKRVNIGIELITNPMVLFLDEPTSGLDSYTANEIMTVVKSLADDGITICATIHSPTSYAFNLFDRLILLLKGEVVFFGERARAIPYFESIAIEETFKSDNEAEWLTDAIVIADKNERASELADLYRQSEFKKDMDVIINENVIFDDDEENTFDELFVKRATATPFWFALGVLMKYRSTANFKSPSFMLARIAQKLLIALLLGTLYLGVGDKFTIDNFTNIAAIMFVWTLIPTVSAVLYIPSLVVERPLYYREKNDGLYRSITYLVSRTIDELIIAFVCSVAFSAILWNLVSLVGSFTIFFLTYFLNIIIGVALAYFIAAISPTLDIANAILPLYCSSLILFSGFLITINDIPNYWYWYSVINFFRYALGVLLKNQFDSTDEGKELKLMRNGEPVSVLEYYGFDDVDTTVNLLILFLFFIVFFVAAFLAMTFIKYQKR